MPTRVRVQMLPKQLRLLRNTDRLSAARGGVGAAKTFAFAFWMMGRSDEFPKASAFVIGADYEQLRRGFFQTLIGILESHGYEEGKHYRYRESPSPMVVFLKNGARIRSLSAALAERIRSVEFQTVLLEEPQTWGNRAEKIYEIILGRLRHSPRSDSAYGDMLQPRLRMSFNPPSIGSWLYKMIEEQWPKLGYSCERMTVRDNVLLRGKDDYVRELENKYHPSRWASEIDGEWSSIGGGAYRGFDRIMNCTVPKDTNGKLLLPDFAIQMYRPLIWALDFNVGWQASVVGQIHTQNMVTKGVKPTSFTSRAIERTTGPEIDGWQERIFYWLDEIFMQDSGMEDVVPEFLRRYGDVARKTGVVLYGDASGGGRSQQLSSRASARSNWAIVVQGLKNAGITVQIRVQSANPSIQEGLNAVVGQFKNQKGYGMLINPSKCPELINDFVMVQIKPGTNEIDKSDKSDEGLKRSHLSDSVGYSIWYEYMMSIGRPPTPHKAFL